MVYLGIDTSCYTTSVALADKAGRLLQDNRRLLKVAEGAKGLRQSEMVFQHIKNLSDLFPAEAGKIGGIAVSAAPRPCEGSYMPVFQVAKSYGTALSRALGVPLYELTHQHAHIGAALIGSELMEGEFLALHVSGGTSDVLLAEIQNGIVEDIRTLGSTADISAGQLIDRIGQKMGLGFPAGPALEHTAGGVAEVIKSSVKGCSASFSGAETSAKAMLDRGAAAEVVALSVQKCIAKTLEKLIRNAVAMTGRREVLLFGGVMCNEYIKKFLQDKLPFGLHFAGRAYSSDNACGLAVQAQRLVENGGTHE